MTALKHKTGLIVGLFFLEFSSLKEQSELYYAKKGITKKRNLNLCAYIKTCNVEWKNVKY